jgi:replicative DNA helicase Mcm
MVPGILVLANNGVACIDELDKMQKEDREGLHTSMEQGIISKSKAGIRAIFKANTSILAAANPIYGRFDLNSDIPDQLKIEPTLMDRFDLVFWFVSSESMSQEKEIAEALRILDPPAAEDTSMLGKYVKLASQNMPGHTPDSMGDIARAWSILKKKSSNPESIGVRHLQAIRRISEASAKIRFSPVVETADVDLASRLMMHSLLPLGGDVDKMLGFGKSTSGAMRFIIQNLKEKRHEASIDEIESWAVSEGLQSQDVRNAISALKREGQIYEPRDGIFRGVA